MTLQEVAHTALEIAIGHVRLFGYSRKQAIRRLLQPVGAFDFFIAQIIYDSVMRIHNALGTRPAVNPLATREYLYMMCTIAWRQLRGQCAPN